MSIATIYGNIQGLKPNQLKQLQRLYQQRVTGDRLTTVELAERIASISTDIKQPLSVYLNRRGQVIRVGVGSPRQTQIPPLELPRYGDKRLSGIRCLTTSLKNQAPSEASLTAMVRQRLDALLVLTLTGQGVLRKGGGASGFIEDAYVAHLTPAENSVGYWEVSPPQELEMVAQQDFLELVDSLEEEFSREYVAQDVADLEERVLIVGLKTDHITPEQFSSGLRELERLVESAGGKVLTTVEQKRSQPHPQTVVGAGKVEEIALQVQTTGANVVVFDRDLSPSQSRNLEVQFGVKVVDRTEVILDIFAQRARTGAGKLQVELAQLEYMLPRLKGRGQAMSRLGGGIGTRGPGETKLETERRAIQKRITRLQKEVNQLQSHRARLRQQRQHEEIPTVAIVGYTNAGKSTLINALTNAQVYTADQLFATLDPTTRRLTITDTVTGAGNTILLTDTVGFIHELPPSLVDSFRATLEEVTEADALLHVVDLSHSDWVSHIESVHKIIGDMPLAPFHHLMVFNKIDQANIENLEMAKQEYPQGVFISATERIGFENLRRHLLNLSQPSLIL
ncbi:MAG: GTPase HflX [Cyanobacterium sp. T60_A2020_053]|nr:GTPase HflX [Cyanobacterium sp. T60_A2020_053]